MMLSGAESIDGLQNGELELLFLPWKQSGVDTNVSVSGEKESGPMECVPLSRWDPWAIKDKVLLMVEEEGDFEVTRVEQSKWVSTMMNSFCKIMGFPIVRREAQCVALFHLLE